MQIDSSIWGVKTDWNEPAASTLDDKYKILVSDQIHDYVADDKLQVNVPWDKTPCYCGLGTESPLSHIKFIRRACYYYVSAADWDGKTYDQLVTKADEDDDRDVTNFILADGWIEYQQNAAHRIMYKSEIRRPLEGYAPIYQRWLPDSAAYYDAQDNWSTIMLSKLMMQVPVKNLILVPYITCTNADGSSSYSNNVHQVDLKSYLDTTTDYNINNCPYVLQVKIRMYYATDGEHLTQRNTEYGCDTCMIMHDSNIYKNINPDNLDTTSSSYTPFDTAQQYNMLYNLDEDFPGMPIIGIVGISRLDRGYYYIGNGTPGIVVQSGEEPITIEAYRVRLKGNIWIGSQYLTETLTYNHNPQNQYDATNEDANYFYYYMNPGTPAEFLETVRSAVACFGLFFVDGYDDVNAELDADEMMLGVLVDGVGHGDYTHGSANRDQIQWSLDDMHEIDYDPSDPPEFDPNVYDTPSILNTPSNCASGTQYYVINAAGVQNLVGELWKAQESKPSDASYMDYNNEQYLSNNPIDMIVSCKRYPLAPAKSSTPENIVLGQYETNVSGFRLTSTTTWIDLGSKLIFGHFKNYLDYETKLVLYVPFCGMIDLDPTVWMGDTVNVLMAIDYITGSVTAYLIRNSDRVVYATAEGNCSVDLPITGLQAATIEAQMLSAKSSLDSSKIMIGAKIVSGVTAFAIAAATGGGGAAAAPAVVGGITTLASTIADGYKINQQTYDLHHINAAPQQIGSSSPLNAWSGELSCRLYVYYPKLASNYDAAAYSHSIGNATVAQGTVGSFGSAGDYASFTNIDLSGVPCTDSEKTMIINALTSGVYL